MKTATAKEKEVSKIYQSRNEKKFKNKRKYA